MQEVWNKKGKRIKYVFNDLRILSSKLRRKESDQDLRPRFQFVDSLKYGVTACPYCGFAAPVKNFDHLTSLHQKRIREKVTSQFMQREPLSGETIDYATAMGQYELALVCAMVMELPFSEQAHLCLQLSWLIRGRLEEADAESGILEEDAYKQLQEKEERYYRQAYDMFLKAFTQEDFPIAGMDQSTAGGYEFSFSRIWRCSEVLRGYRTDKRCIGKVKG